jgi:hypothetical protein
MLLCGTPLCFDHVPRLDLTGTEKLIEEAPIGAQSEQEQNRTEKKDAHDVIPCFFGGTSD